MMEYAITEGPGTLYDYGVVELYSAKLNAILEMAYESSFTVALQACGDDCETGDLSRVKTAETTLVQTPLVTEGWPRK